jgi:hypothetical protein
MSKNARYLGLDVRAETIRELVSARGSAKDDESRAKTRARRNL